VVASRRQVEHRLPYLVDYGFVSGGDYADLVVPVPVARAHVVHAAVEAASPVFLALPFWQPCVAGHAIFSIPKVVEKLDICVNVKYD